MADIYNELLLDDLNNVGTQESLCNSCKEINEITADNVVQEEKITRKEISVQFDYLVDDIFAEALDDIEELTHATRSLSQITLECPVINAIDCDIEENKEHNYAVVHTYQLQNNISGVDNIDNLQNNDNNALNDTDLESTDLELRDYDNNFDKHFNKQLRKKECADKVFVSKEIQTEDLIMPNDDGQMWDPDFPSGSQLEQIDHAIKVSVFEHPKCKRKLTFNDNENYPHPKVMKKSKEVTKPDYNSMVSIKLNREKRLADLSNDLFELSTYLDDVRKVLKTKEPSANVKIPSPPVLMGYDSQFDFLNQSRFDKLPIKVQSIDNKVKSESSSSQKNKSVESSYKVSMKKNSTKLPLKPLKGITNKNISVPKKNFYQSTIEEAFRNGKENEDNKKIVDNSSTASAQSSNSTKSLIDGSTKSESSSILMYEYNPLRLTKIPRKK